MNYTKVVIILLLVVCASVITIEYSQNQKLKEQLNQTQIELDVAQNNVSASQRELVSVQKDLLTTQLELIEANKSIQKYESDSKIIFNYTTSANNQMDKVESYNQIYNKITVWDYSHKKEYQSLYDKNLEIMDARKSTISYIIENRGVLESRLGKEYIKNILIAYQDGIISDQKYSDTLKQWISASSTNYYT